MGRTRLHVQACERCAPPGVGWRGAALAASGWGRIVLRREVLHAVGQIASRSRPSAETPPRLGRRRRVSRGVRGVLSHMSHDPKLRAPREIPE